MSRMPCSWQSSVTARQYSGGGTITPPTVSTGSPMNAAIRSAPSRPLVAEVPEHRRVLELRHLRCRNLGDLRAAMADLAQLDAPERVEVFVALSIEVARSLAAHEQERGPGEAPRMDDVLAVPRREL